MVLNSLKLTTPSLSMSKRQMMAWHSAMFRRAPSLASTSFRLSGVMHPVPSISYIPNVSRSHVRSSSSSSPAASACSPASSSSSSSGPPSPPVFAAECTHAEPPQLRRRRDLAVAVAAE
ncbi:hypothetical protein SORBI_3004G120733 [Sorghum bicolor]|uniref:Uncharacterized protein n=1 Tax=Sorghum bicolor TaxID=4558 RepID=A0A1Z5RM00_SORBI|nr:hypothetical protein SORBI_3004G120733 [Sorghum bicolor]